MNTYYNEYCTINSVEDYIGKVKEAFGEWFVNDERFSAFFRGQESDLDLLPSVFREVDNKRYNERLICTYFNSLYKNYTNERFTTKQEIFSYMQHYGFPTRLLDWTENSLMALFFAIDKSNFEKAENPVVWMFNPAGLNSIDIPEINGILDSTSPRVLARLDMIGYISDENIDEHFFNQYPHYSAYRSCLDNPLCFYPESAGNQRIIVQKGVFTIHGAKRISINQLMKQEKKEVYLKKFIINKEKIKFIRQDLRVMGITPRSVYPDLSGLNSEIRELSLF